MRKSFLLFLFIGISLFISCESQEDIFKTQENVNSVYKTTINNYLTKIKLTAAGNIENAKKINTLIESLDYNNIRYYDFESLKKILVVNLNNSSDSSSAVQTKVLFVILNEEIISSRLVTFNNKSSASFNDMTIISAFKKDTNISGYSGTITFFNLFQRMLLSNQYYNGNLVISKAIEKNPNAMMSKSVLCIEWYLVTTYQDGFQTKEYQYTTCDSCSLDEIFESLCDSDGGTGGSGGIDASQEIEDRINDNNLDPCTKGILEKLKNLSGGDITNMLKRFTPPGSIFNINMITGKVINNDPNVWAQTTPIKGSRTDINMVFNENYIYGTNYSSRPTDLSVATTMAHEVIHAYLISLLEENKACGASGICDFPTIYDAYVQQQISKDPNLTADEHHELIAKNYVYTIASTIQEFHTGQYTDYPYQNYLDMAWGGLVGTTIFNKDFPNDPNDKNYKYRERILDRINTEKKGEQYQGYFPMGTPCKK